MLVPTSGQDGFRRHEQLDHSSSLHCYPVGIAPDHMRNPQFVLELSRRSNNLGQFFQLTDAVPIRMLNGVYSQFTCERIPSRHNKWILDGWKRI
ncbi:hypothetical protein BN14_07449 [Rhizoctonia solani AG-1 IB]|uniref:Uncharacterized protein n=1 Tax=Thanatephorus cucumeris (strain AG1-IB / isolate 7/3/14) TaxID=1108050 RepID=M5C1W1_THACB|nr:hypothetical protein BN14_07449 [Rhizoctonia solani AG-1 IB]